MNWIQNWTLSISLTFWRFPHHSMHTHTHAYMISYDGLSRISYARTCFYRGCIMLHFITSYNVISNLCISIYLVFFSWILNFIKSIFFGGFLVFDMMKFSLRLFFRFEFHVMKILILILICHSLKMKKKNRLKMCGDAHTFQSIWFFDGEFQQNKINK